MPKPGVSPTSNHRGLLVVIGLALIFFILIGLLLKFGGDKDAPRQGELPGELYVLPMRLRIRTQPTAKAPVVDTVSRGDKLDLIEERGPWVRVRNGRGIVGWSERSGLERAAEYERRQSRSAAIKKLPALQGQTDERTPLYAGPGIFYPLVGELESRAKVKVYTRDHDFYAIDFGGEIAYAEVDSVDVSATEGTPRFDVAAGGVDASERETPIPPFELPELPKEEIPEAGDLGGIADTDVDSGRVYPVVPPGGTDPEVIDRKVPHYPAMARRSGIEGAVVLRAIVRRNGRAENVVILRDLPYGLGESAREAVQEWRFRPATYQGQAIDVYYTVTVNYRLTR